MMNKLIAKEEITGYNIIPAFVDKTEHWKEQLRYAERLGNEFKGKTVITFETTSGPRTVKTTVWSVTDNYMILKGGTNIPLISVIDLHY
jgi:hypothetical protein